LLPEPKSETWKTVSAPSEGLYKEKGSRFISYLFPVSGEEEIRDILQKIRKEHHSARHHCYAWRLGTEVMHTRTNDDGEPSSTAGKPILGQILSHDLTNVLLVVVRYFGGTLLGTSGLINAYRIAAALAIAGNVIETRDVKTRFSIECPYPLLNDVMQIIKSEGYRQDEISMTERCTIRISVVKKDAERAESLLKSIYGVTVNKSDVDK
jgi:uncharacterized YigZ family protein